MTTTAFLFNTRPPGSRTESWGFGFFWRRKSCFSRRCLRPTSSCEPRRHLASRLEVLNVPLATLNTLVLITSSVTWSWPSQKRTKRTPGGFRLYQSLTILLGFAF